MTVTRKGKIARLSFATRNEINLRLRDGQVGPTLLTWLNKTEKLTGSSAITAQNLSEWRAGGYEDWIKDQEKVDRIRQLSEFARSMAEASGNNLSEGAAAIAAGRILELLETTDEEDLVGLSLALAKLRDADAKTLTARVNETKLGQKEREINLAVAKFQRQTAELFLSWYDKKKARDIVESGLSNTEKIEQLGRAMFGEDWGK